MTKKLFIVFFLLTFFFTCSKNPTSPTLPSDNRPIIDMKDFGKINVILIDYDIVNILHQYGLDLRSSNISKIEIGSKNASLFRRMQTSNSFYDSTTHNYIIHFDFTVKMDSSKVIAPLTIRYFFADSSFIDTDTTVALYKYPYPNTEIIVDSSILPGGEPFQDISRVAQKLYYHPIGPWGLFEYDFNTKIKRELYGYISGDNIAADSNFVFCDVNSDGNVIIRYNSKSRFADLRVPFQSNHGMEIYNNFLYVMDGLTPFLRKYTLDGIELDSIPYHTDGYYLTILDSVIYNVKYFNWFRPDQILRYDLRTRQFLSNIYSPAFHCDGIKFYDDKLYYCDYFKHYVGAVHISNLR